MNGNFNLGNYIQNVKSQYKAQIRIPISGKKRVVKRKIF